MAYPRGDSQIRVLEGSSGRQSAFRKIVFWGTICLCTAIVFGLVLLKIWGLSGQEVLRIARYAPFNEAVDQVIIHNEAPLKESTPEEAIKSGIERIDRIQSPGRILAHNVVVISLFALAFPWVAMALTRGRLETKKHLLHLRMGLLVGPLAGFCFQLVRLGLVISVYLLTNPSELGILARHGIPELLGVILFVSIPIRYYQNFVRPAQEQESTLVGLCYGRHSIRNLPTYLGAMCLIVVAALIEAWRLGL